MYNISAFFSDFLDNFGFTLSSCFNILDNIMLDEGISLLDIILYFLLASVLITIFIPIVTQKVVNNENKDSRPDSVRNSANSSDD